MFPVVLSLFASTVVAQNLLMGMLCEDTTQCSQGLACCAPCVADLPCGPGSAIPAICALGGCLPGVHEFSNITNNLGSSVSPVNSTNNVVTITPSQPAVNPKTTELPSNSTQPQISD
ncbi:unnamed protein product, partial [Mesorhabditis belari]|uniref:Uncharacterized protein n=1 Tax=Mesorhabditis belari TaxID=2138241 RepID=A0AAF3FLB0_9BILA